MSETWIESVIERLKDSRYGIERAVRETPPDAWQRASDYAGWTYHDQLAHLADSHRAVQSVITAIMEGRDPDFGRFDRLDEVNEEVRQRHLSSPVDQLLADFVEASATTQDIVSKVSDEQAAADVGRFNLGQALQGFSMHDGVHLEEIRKAASA